MKWAYLIFGLAVLLVVMFNTNKAEAELVYTEPFDYGVTNGVLAGRNGGTGFFGAWAQQIPGIVYTASGLSFSDLPVSGGSASATGIDGIGNALLFRPFTAVLTGTYYGSFLSRAVLTNSQPAVKMGVSHGPSSVTPHFGNYGVTAGQELFVSAGGMLSWSGSPFEQEQIYLTLFKFDTVVQTNKAWVLNASQYDAFKVGGFTEAELDAATVGNGSDQVWARAAANSIGPSPEPTVITASHLNLLLDAVGGVSAALTVDELRLSNANLNEVTVNAASAGPKPSLRIVHSGNIALLVWSTNFPGFALEQASSPNATNWAAPANSPIVVADSFVCPINMTTSAFFRLRKQLP